MPRLTRAVRLLGVGASVLLAALLSVSEADGCMLCESERAAEVRAGLVDDSLAENFTAVAAPFLILAAVVALSHVCPDRRAADPSGRDHR
ncbi:MAG: hypothetical protein SFZ24_09950 [Planctomycetota bacterium]|nr:hypothetical protein [Planctomycetota bacterium]